MTIHVQVKYLMRFLGYLWNLIFRFSA